MLSNGSYRDHTFRGMTIYNVTLVRKKITGRTNFSSRRRSAVMVTQLIVGYEVQLHLQPCMNQWKPLPISQSQFSFDLKQ